MIHTSEDQLKINGIDANESQYKLSTRKIFVSGDWTDELKKMFFVDYNEIFSKPFYLESHSLGIFKTNLLNIEIDSLADDVVKYKLEFIIT